MQLCGWFDCTGRVYAHMSDCDCLKRLDDAARKIRLHKDWKHAKSWEESIIDMLDILVLIARGWDPKGFYTRDERCDP